MGIDGAVPGIQLAVIALPICRGMRLASNWRDGKIKFRFERQNRCRTRSDNAWQSLYVPDYVVKIIGFTNTVGITAGSHTDVHGQEMILSKSRIDSMEIPETAD